MAEAGFEQKLQALVRARRREPGRILGEIGKGMLRGAAGLQYIPKAVDQTAQMAALTKQYETLGELEAAAGGDPVKMAESKLDFLAELVGEARQRLNKKAEVYSRAQYQRANLLLDNLDKQVDNQRQLIGTLEPARRGGGAGAGAVDQSKVARVFRAIEATMAKKEGGDVGQLPAIGSLITNARMTPAEQEVLFDRLEDDAAYMQMRSEVPGAGAAVSSAYNKLETLGTTMGGDGVKGVTEALRSQLSKDAALAQEAAASDDPQGYLDSLPGELRNRVKEMHFELDERGEPRLDPETQRPILKKSAEVATEARLTSQGLERSYQDMATTINQLVTGSGGGKFANEMKDILSSYGAGSVEELFARYGLDTASVQAREDALRGKYGGERADIAAQLQKLAVAPKAPVARAAFEVMQDPSFSAEMKKRGYEDPAAGLRAMAREEGKEMRAERKETRQQARARLARPRVVAAMREKLYAPTGPQPVDT